MKKIQRKVVVTMLAFSLLVPTVATSNEAEAKKKKTYVYYARYSKKYHRSKRCRTLSRSKVIYKATKKNAKRKNLKACKVCY